MWIIFNSYTAGRCVNWYNTLENYLEAFHKAQHTVTIHMASQFYSYSISTVLCTYIHLKTYAGMFTSALLAVASN